MRFQKNRPRKPPSSPCHEHFRAVHPPSRGHLAAGRRAVHARHGILQDVAGGTRPQGGLPDGDGLRCAARRRSRHHGIVCCSAAGAPVRPDRRHHGNDVGEHAGFHQRDDAVRSRPQGGWRGKGCSGRHQRSCRRPARRPAQPAFLPQSESGGRTHHDHGDGFGPDAGH